MAKYRHKCIERGYMKGGLYEEGQIVTLNKPLDKPCTWLEPLDYEFGDEKEDGSFEIEYNEGVAPYVPGVEVVDDEDDEPEEPKIKAGKEAIKLAEDNQIQLSDITGTGKDGAITKKDVQAFIDEAKGGDEV